MSRRPKVVRAVLLLVVAAALASATMLPAGAAPARGAQESAPKPERVLILSLPRLRWEDVAMHDMPALEELLAESSVASLSVRTIGPRSSLGEGYATVGAGNRTAVPEIDAGNGLQRDESDFEGDGVAVFTRRMGSPPLGDVFTISFPAIKAANDRLLYGSEPGMLGQALRDDSLQTAVVGNADAEGSRDREAVLAMMDDRGTVVNGRVDNGLNVLDPESPFGTASSPKLTAEAFDDAWSASDVVLLEASDLERADRYGIRALPPAADELTAQARETADELVQMAMNQVDLERDLVIVMAPASPTSEPEGLTVFAMAGPGVEPGLASSGTTRRAGYVTLPDIGPTVLERLAVDQPDAMTGTPIADGMGPDSVPVRRFVRDNELAIFRDSATGPITVLFITLQVVSYLLAVAAVISRRRRLRPIVSFLLLMVLAMPSLTYLSGLVPYDSLSVPGYGVVLLVLAAVAAVAARAVGALVGRWAPRVGELVPPLLLIAMTWLVMVVDVVLLGGRLQLNTVFGYSPIVAGRFAGFGNQAFSLLTMAAVVVASGIWSLRRLNRGAEPVGDDGRRRIDRPALAMMLGFFAATIVVDGHPGFGSDVGGVLATVPAAAVLLLLLFGVKIGLRRSLLIAAGTAAVLAVFAAADLARPPTSRTHLGRLVSSTIDSRGADLLTVLQRKQSANVGILMSSVWTWVIPVALGLMVFVTWRRKDLVRSVEEEAPGLRATLWAAIVLSLLGFALNDSGVAVPAMMLAVLLPYLTYLSLRAMPDRPAALVATGSSPPVPVGPGDGDPVPVGTRRPDDARSDRGLRERDVSEGAGSDDMRPDGAAPEDEPSDDVGPDGPGSDDVGSDGPGSDDVGSDGAGSDGAGSDRIASDDVGTEGAGSDGPGSDRTASDDVGSDGAGADDAGPDGQGSKDAMPDEAGADGAGSAGSVAERAPS
jgi:hypothetical protein